MIFNVPEFQAVEFDLCSRKIAANAPVYADIPRLDNLFHHQKSYVGNTVHLLSRLVNNCIILMSQRGFSNDPAIHNLTP